MQLPFTQYQDIPIGYEPVRVDIITATPYLSFEKIWENRKKGTYGKIKVNTIKPS